MKIVKYMHLLNIFEIVLAFFQAALVDPYLPW